MAILLRRFLWVTVAMLLVSCGGGSSDQSTTPQAKTTMLVYMVASNLVEAGNGPSWSIARMLDAQASQDVNIILQVGGGDQKGPIPGMDMTQTRRYQISATKPASGGVLLNQWQIELLPEAQQPKTQAMNDGNTLRHFIEWGTQNFPADKVHLVMYDHGGGPIGGYGNDEATGGGIAMSVPTIAKALADSKAHFELIGFDACLMANIEVASLLAPYGNYLAATEDVTLFWDWKAILDFLASSPSATGDQLGKQIVQGYKASQTNYDLAIAYVTTAIIDLRKIPALVNEVGKLTSALQQKLSQEGLSAWLQIATATRHARSFQTNIFSALDLVDLLSWAKELLNAGAISSSRSDAVESALRKAVVYTDDDQANDDQTNGLSIYFPRFTLSNSAMTNKYLNLGYATELTQLVKSYTQFADSGAIPQIQIGMPNNSSGHITSMVSASITTAIQPFDSAYAVLEQGGILSAMQEISTQGLQLRMEQPNLWPHLDRQIVSLLRLKEIDLEVYVVPVLTHSDLNPSNPNAYRPGMLLAAKNDQGQIVVRGRIELQSIVGGAIAQFTLKPGEIFFPLRYSQAAAHYQPDFNARLISPDGDWIVQMQPLTSGGYTVYTAASDLKGQLQVSPAGIALPLP